MIEGKVIRPAKVMVERKSAGNQLDESLIS